MHPIAAHCSRSQSSPDLKAMQPAGRTLEDAYMLAAVPLSQAPHVNGPALVPPHRMLGLRSQDNKYFLLSKQVAEESDSFLSAWVRDDMSPCRDAHGNYAVPVMGKPLKAIIKYLTMGELPPAADYRAVRAAARHLCISSLVTALDAPLAMEKFEYAPNLLLGLNQQGLSDRAVEMLQEYYSAFDAKIETAIGDSICNPVRLRLRPDWLGRSHANQPKSLTNFYYISPPNDANWLPTNAIAVVWREVSNTLVIRGAEAIEQTFAYNPAFTGQNGVQIPVYVDISFTLPCLGESEAERVAREAAEVDAKILALSARESDLAFRDEVLKKRQTAYDDRAAKLDEAEKLLSIRVQELRSKKGGARIWAKVCGA